MMHDHGQSDSSVVPMKSPNNAAEPVAEATEGSGLAKGNSPDSHGGRTQGRVVAPDGIERVRQAAKRDRKQRFTALLHHVYDIDRVRTAYFALRRDAAAGIDGETWRHYGEALEANLQDLAARVKRGAFRASPVRRVYIPKADGRQRPLGIPTVTAYCARVQRPVLIRWSSRIHSIRSPASGSAILFERTYREPTRGRVYVCEAGPLGTVTLPEHFTDRGAVPATTTSDG